MHPLIQTLDCFGFGWVYQNVQPDNTAEMSHIAILSIPTGEWNFADHCIYPMAAQGASRFFSIVPFINNPAETTYTDYMPAFEFEFQGLFFSLACFSGFRDCPLFARFFIFFETHWTRRFQVGGDFVVTLGQCFQGENLLQIGQKPAETSCIEKHPFTLLAGEDHD